MEDINWMEEIQTEESEEGLLEKIKEKVREGILDERPEFKNFKGKPPLQDFYFLYGKILDRGRKKRNPNFAGFDEETTLRIAFYINYQTKRVHLRNDEELGNLLKVAEEMGYSEAIKGKGTAEEEYKEICNYLKERGEVKKKKEEKDYYGSHLPRRF